MGIKVKGTAAKKLKEIIKRCKNLKEPMKTISVHMKNETLRNFDEEHSFDGKSWKKSKRAKEQGGKTLRDTGRLYGSFNIRSGKKYARVGTNVKYARVLNRGAEKGEFGKAYFTVKQHRRKGVYHTKKGIIEKTVRVKPHLRRARVPWGDIPAYRYMGISQEAKERYKEILLKYILTGK